MQSDANIGHLLSLIAIFFNCINSNRIWAKLTKAGADLAETQLLLSWVQLKPGLSRAYLILGSSRELDLPDLQLRNWALFNEIFMSFIAFLYKTI